MVLRILKSQNKKSLLHAPRLHNSFSLLCNKQNDNSIQNSSKCHIFMYESNAKVDHESITYLLQCTKSLIIKIKIE